MVCSDLSRRRCGGPMGGPPQRTGRCTPPPLTPLHPPPPPLPRRLRTLPAVEEGGWVPRTPDPRRGEVEAARLRLESSKKI